MTRFQLRRHEIVSKYHRNMLITSLGFAFGAPVGIILTYCYGPEIDRVSTTVLFWLVGAGPVAGIILLALYLILVVAYAAWVEFRRYDH